MKKLLLIVAMLVIASSAQARDPAQVSHFRKANVCPATAKVQTSCAGWVVNHIVPLCYGGIDAPENMEWEQKAASYKRDAFERALCAKQAKSALGAKS